MRVYNAVEGRYATWQSSIWTFAPCCLKKPCFSSCISQQHCYNPFLSKLVVIVKNETHSLLSSYILPSAPKLPRIICGEENTRLLTAPQTMQTYSLLSLSDFCVGTLFC